MNTLRPPKHVIDNSKTLKLPNQTRASLSRSPHPYHRRGGSLILDDNSPHREHGSSSQTPELTSRSDSSESGTEADDERGPILKGLPAPPLHSRKGLRGSTPKSLTPLISPLPTPPVVFREARTGFFDENLHDRQRTQEHLASQKRRTIYQRRRRGEIVRRITEVLLLVCTGSVVWAGAGGQNSLARWKYALLLFVSIPAFLYLLYPLRLAQLSYTSGKPAVQALRVGFHVPSRFDPGPLLYPLALPVLISMSLHGHDSTYLPVNMVCGLASIPKSVTATWSRPNLAGFVRWNLTMLPLNTSTLSLPFVHRWVNAVATKPIDLYPVNAEDLVLLYPLHQALTSVLEYLTTTSLDPSELQLLSSALISLLIFATTPQAVTLKALLWVGGLSVFVTCRNLMSWEVALARIPSWKFARRQRRDATFFQKLDQTISSFIMRPRRVQESGDSSDSDNFGPRWKATRRSRHLQNLQIPSIPEYNDMHEPVSATELQQNGSVYPDENEFSIPRRRNTFAALDSQTKRNATRSFRRARDSTLTPPTSFMSLTNEQAKARKYTYAAAVYITVAVIILVPVRYYVSACALYGHEPFGWALGYLLGNIPEFRFQMVSNNLERWIPLPVRLSDPSVPQHLHTVEEFRQRYIGAANARLVLCAYCLLILFTGILVVLQLTSLVEVDTRRKVFHGVMVAMLLPTIFVDPCFIALALAIILSIFLLLDLFRASQLPPISRPLTNFLAPYVDGRDHRGPIIVSHIFLLIGCAIPLWLSLAGLPRIGVSPWEGWETPMRDLSMISGVVCVGMGDAAASLIGRRYGKTKWYWGGGKSLEGSLAFAVAVVIGLMFSYVWIRIGGWVSWQGSNLPTALIKCAVAGSGASLLESTLTAANDNVVVPVGLWLLVRGLQI